MLICKNCGSDNELGRVFCLDCGERLDLTNMGQDEIQQVQKASFFKAHGLKIVMGLVMLVLMVIGLALWPNLKPLGEEANRNGRRTVDSTLSSLRRVAKGQSQVRSFKEADINGYFEYQGKAKLGADSVSFAIGDESFKVRFVSTVFTFKLAGERKLKLSQDFTCVSAEGGIAIVDSSIGHLPLFGLGSTLLVPTIYGKLADQREWKSFEHVSDVEIEEGKILIKVQR